MCDMVYQILQKLDDCDKVIRLICRDVDQGPDFQKILRQSYDNIRIFVQYTLILRRIYDNRTNTPNIVNTKTSFKVSPHSPAH